MLRDNRFDYFKVFIEMTEISGTAARMLDSLLRSYSAEDLPEMLQELHKIEHQGDELMHMTMNRLAKEFLPPIEREDIVTLIQRLDDVTDNIEDVAMTLYMYNIKELIPEALAFSELILEGTDLLNEVAKEFIHFKKSTDIKKKIISVNTLEGKGDDLYMKTLHNMYETNDDVKELMIWTRTVDKMEKTLDSLEECSNAMESIILKNS